jgi:pyrroline-5-carboxylate reductase
MDAERERVRRLIGTTLVDADLPVVVVGEDRFMTQLTGEHKRTIPVLLHVDERSLKVSSLLAGAPDEQHDAVHRLLLHRNQRPAPVHFALDDEGDLLLVGRLPHASVDAAAIDELLGLVLAMSDDVFDRVLAVGFASYLEAEQRWRAREGLPPNPVGAAVAPTPRGGPVGERQGPVVAIVGAGNLGGALAAGLLAAGAVRADRLRCVTATPASADALSERLSVGPGVVGTDAHAAVHGADVVMLGVKPPKVVPLIAELAAELAPGAVVVSLAAGVDLATLGAALPAGTPVVRVMTNTPVRIRAATSLLSVAPDTDARALALVERLFGALGATHVIDEALLDVATALAGSGPAYVFLLAEVLRDAGVTLGLAPDAAQSMAATMLEGAARLLEGGEADPVALRSAVTSPGGMTAEAIAVFEADGLRATALKALRAAVARAAGLAAGAATGPAAGP